jgi:uncharacterized protein
MMLPLVQPFHKAGMDVLVYDARNYGRSDRDSFYSLPRFTEDPGCALGWILERTPEHKIVVMGHSVGAAAVALLLQILAVEGARHNSIEHFQ